MRLIKTNSNLDIQQIIEKEYNIKIENNYFSYVDQKLFLEFEQKEYLEIKKIIKNCDEILKKRYSLYFKNISYYLNGVNSLFIDYIKKDISNYMIGRYDYLIDQNGVIKIIEINAHTPGIITDTYIASKLLKSKNYNNPNAYFKSHIQKFFKDFKNKKLGILLANSGSDEDFLVGNDYKNMLLDIFGEENIVIGDIFETNIVGSEYFTIKGEKIDVILNFCPLDFFLTDLDYANTFFTLIKEEKIHILNPIESIILQDKIIFSIIWDNIDTFSKKDQIIIKKHFPYTTTIPQNEKKFIAKDRWGRISKGTYEKNFDTNIKNTKDFIYQEKIKSKTINKNGDFCVFGAFTDLKNMKGFITRIQNEFITNDETVKINMCYIKKTKNV